MQIEKLISSVLDVVLDERLPCGFTLDPGFIRPVLGCSKQITLHPCFADKLDGMGVVSHCYDEEFRQAIL